MLLLKLSKSTSFIARKFAGTRKSLAKALVKDATEGCICDDIIFHFDKRLMDQKRLIALASGALEREEFILAKRYFNKDDRIMEFGCGLGVAAARLIKAVQPASIICFEANPLAIEYASVLFSNNNMNVNLLQGALGDGSKKNFYACNDYILSSFDEPSEHQNYKKIEVATFELSDLIHRHKPNAIFCDIEGAEQHFCDPHKMENIDKVVIEFHPEVYGKAVLKQLSKAFIDADFQLRETLKQTYFFERTA
ncbi:FkbM family methyltransferase [Candidatus Puniceispirillum marinum]|nr:FkbM family methyltransferase [Candidatus Puniceispirillum marinum]